LEILNHYSGNDSYLIIRR